MTEFFDDPEALPDGWMICNEIAEELLGDVFATEEAAWDHLMIGGLDPVAVAALGPHPYGLPEIEAMLARGWRVFHTSQLDEYDVAEGDEFVDPEFEEVSEGGNCD